MSPPLYRFVISAAIVVVLAGSVFGITRTVTNLSDSGAGSLRDTIAASGSGDTINFSVTGTNPQFPTTLLQDQDMTVSVRFTAQDNQLHTDSLLIEGEAMLRAVAADFAALDGVEVTTTRDIRLSRLSSTDVDVIPVASSDDERAAIARIEARSSTFCFSASLADLPLISPFSAATCADPGPWQFSQPLWANSGVLSRLA